MWVWTVVCSPAGDWSRWPATRDQTKQEKIKLIWAVSQLAPGVTHIFFFFFWLISHHLSGFTSRAPDLSINGHKQKTQTELDTEALQTHGCVFILLPSIVQWTWEKAADLLKCCTQFRQQGCGSTRADTWYEKAEKCSVSSVSLKSVLCAQINGWKQNQMCNPIVMAKHWV